MGLGLKGSCGLQGSCVRWGELKHLHNRVLLKI